MMKVRGVYRWFACCRATVQLSLPFVGPDPEVSVIGRIAQEWPLRCVEIQLAVEIWFRLFVMRWGEAVMECLE